MIRETKIININLRGKKNEISDLRKWTEINPMKAQNKEKKQIMILEYQADPSGIDVILDSVP